MTDAEITERNVDTEADTEPDTDDASQGDATEGEAAAAADTEDADDAQDTEDAEAGNGLEEGLEEGDLEEGLEDGDASPPGLAAGSTNTRRDRCLAASRRLPASAASNGAGACPEPDARRPPRLPARSGRSSLPSPRAKSCPDVTTAGLRPARAQSIRCPPPSGRLPGCSPPGRPATGGRARPWWRRRRQRSPAVVGARPGADRPVRAR